MLRNVLIAAAGAALLAALAASQSGCAPAPPPATAVPAGSARPSAATPAPANTQPSQPIKGISKGTRDQPARYTMRNAQGKTIYDVRSLQAIYDRATDGTSVATFSNPNVTFHDRQGHTMLATAPEAVAHDKDKTVTMTGGVHAKTDSGEVLTCDSLSYDAHRELLRGVGHVVLVDTRANNTVTGQTITTDISFEHVVLSGTP